MPNHYNSGGVMIACNCGGLGSCGFCMGGPRVIVAGGGPMMGGGMMMGGGPMMACNCGGMGVCGFCVRVIY